MLLSSECTKSLSRWPPQSTIPSLFCQRPFKCHLLYTSWWHQIAHYSLLTLFCETEWQFTCAQLCIAIRYKPFGLIQVSKDFRSVCALPTWKGILSEGFHELCNGRVDLQVLLKLIWYWIKKRDGTAGFIQQRKR